MKIKLTPENWCRLLGVEIIDPDGWNRKAGNFQQDWVTPLTFDEFVDKANASTTNMHPNRETLREIARQAI